MRFRIGWLWVLGLGLMCYGPIAAMAQIEPQPPTWYYCDASKTYYPYVEKCNGSWRPVHPKPGSDFNPPRPQVNAAPRPAPVPQANGEPMVSCAVDDANGFHTERMTDSACEASLQRDRRREAARDAALAQEKTQTQEKPLTQEKEKPRDSDREPHERKAAPNRNPPPQTAAVPKRSPVAPQTVPPAPVPERPNYLARGLLILLAAYFIPTLIAATRRHPGFFAIAALNLLAGWTFVGWLVALLWSFKPVERYEPA